MIHAPDDLAKRAEWRDGLHTWRQAALKALDYRGTAYEDPAFAWMQSCRACAKVMLFDRSFVDPAKGRFLVEE